MTEGQAIAHIEELLGELIEAERARVLEWVRGKYLAMPVLRLDPLPALPAPAIVPLPYVPPRTVPGIQPWIQPSPHGMHCACELCIGGGVRFTCTNGGGDLAFRH